MTSNSHRPPVLGCIADDVTGATDLAINLAQGGMRVEQVLGVPDAESLACVGDVDAIVIALKTRSIDPSEAIAQSLGSLRWLRKLGIERFYFKYCSTFDSTVRGNIRPVTEALIRELGIAQTIFCPAFPRAGRTVYRGHLFVGDKLLNESPIKNTWTEGSVPPIELHHFQPVVIGDLIYVVGALTGPYPGETPVPTMYIYDTKTDIWREGPAIPAARLRGSTGNVVENGKIYVAAGIGDGHRGDHKKWFDVYDIASGQWQVLPDCPRARDHHQAAIVDGRLYLVGGRQSKAPTNVMGNTQAEIDVFDFQSNQWTTLDQGIPTQRAGLSVVVVGKSIFAIGGEALGQKQARSEVEVLDTTTGSWRSLAPLQTGRHGSGVIFYNDRLYIASGSANMGGGPELTTQEIVKIAQW